MGAFGFLRQSPLDRRRSGSVMAMGQAVWTGSISFGLVSIPVKLYPATEPKDVRFHLYDRLTGKRVRYERVTRAEDAPTFEPEPPEDELAATEPAPSRQEDRSDRAVAPSFETRPVEPMDVVRGVELPTGDLVTVSDEELLSIAPERHAVGRREARQGVPRGAVGALAQQAADDSRRAGRRTRAGPDRRPHGSPPRERRGREEGRREEGEARRLRARDPPENEPPRRNAARAPAKGVADHRDGG